MVKIRYDMAEYISLPEDDVTFACGPTNSLKNYEHLTELSCDVSW